MTDTSWSDFFNEDGSEIGSTDGKPDVNGSGSLFNQFITGLSGLTNTAASAYTTVRGGNHKPKPKPPVTATNSFTKFLPWALVGAVVLGLAFFFIRRK